MKKVEYSLDEPATQLLQGALADCDAKTVLVLLKQFGPLDFVGGFDRQIESNGKKVHLPVGSLNSHYLIWAVGAPRDARIKPPHWNYEIDQIWRGKEIKERGVIV